MVFGPLSSVYTYRLKDNKSDKGKYGISQKMRHDIARLTIDIYALSDRSLPVRAARIIILLR